MLSAMSFHFAAHKDLLLNHGVHKGMHQDLTFKSNCPNSISPILRNKLAKFRVSSKSLLIYPKVLAKLRGDNESESLRQTTSIDDAKDAIARNSEGAPSSEDCQSITGQNPYPYQCDLQVYLDKLRAIHLPVLASEQWNSSCLKLCHRTYLLSATNLIHYLALRCLDIRELNEALLSIGLMSLEHANSSVLASITARIQILGNQAPCARNNETGKMTDFGMSSTTKMASAHATALLGPAHGNRKVHIMVTVGREAIANEKHIPDLLNAGADIFRINCAYDDSSVSNEIIRIVKRSSQMLEKPCHILMDLAGPKLRTGMPKSIPIVTKISPRKDAKGRAIFPARAWLSLPGCGPPPQLNPDAVFFVKSKRFLRRLETGDVLRFVDARGRKRSLKVCKKHAVSAGFGCVAECTSTAYVELGTELRVEGKKGKDSVGRIVHIPGVDQYIRLRVGDLLTIHRTSSFSMNESSYASSSHAPRITCDSGHLFDSVKPGVRIAFDDGKIWGVVKGASIGEIVVSITHASPKGSKLGSGKSINAPESEMQFDGLTSKDLMDLDFVGKNADMVGVSFVRDVHDVEVVASELRRRKLDGLGLVLKIETRGAFEKLSLLLLRAMQLPNPFGVMIARGDLAVECGWEQMAGIQEEILSVCNAAHVPTIWATQVLDSLVKSGIPTRAEITDVASGMRANCIMLNKGKNIVEAVSSLESIMHEYRRNDMKASLNLLSLSRCQ